MLTYTFSKREKVMLAVLAFVGLAILWYRLVFVSVQNRVSELEVQIGEAQNQLTVGQTQAMSISQMRASVDDFESQGYKPVYLPNYDNTQNLMAYLNAVLGSTREYSIEFDDPSISEEDGLVHRNGRISFGTNTYSDARSIMDAITHGSYPCKVNAFGIVDHTVATTKGNASTKNSPVSTNIELTFLEKPSANSDLSTKKDGEVKGQDLSKMSDWNK